jgi:hypothetical protein
MKRLLIRVVGYSLVICFLIALFIIIAVLPNIPYAPIKAKVAMAYADLRAIARRGQTNAEPFPPDLYAKDGSSYRVILRDGEWLVYSVGPDGKDDNATIRYDPTNGLESAGDIIRSMSTSHE